MKTVTKDILRSVIVLAAIALVAGLLLGIVYPITRLSEKELDERAMKPLQGIYPSKNGYTVLEKNTAADAKVPYYFQVNGEETYIVLAVGKGGYGGDIQMYTVIQDNKIVKLAKGKNAETIAVPDSFYEQFYNKEITSIKFTVGGNIDKVSGATMSSTGITDAVNNAVEFYRSYHKQEQRAHFPLWIDKEQDGTIRYEISYPGSYVNNGETVAKVLKLLVTVKDDVVTSVADNGSTFSPPQYGSGGLKPENLNKYVGKNLKDAPDFVLGEDIDNASGATGTSQTIVNAMNVLIKIHNGGNVLLYEKTETGYVYSIQEAGSYVNEGQTQTKLLRLQVAVDENGVITAVTDNGSTFSPLPWNPGLGEANLNQYVGKNLKTEKDFALGDNIDNASGATGTSQTIASAMNKIKAHYNGEAI